MAKAREPQYATLIDFKTKDVFAGEFLEPCLIILDKKQPPTAPKQGQGGPNQGAYFIFSIFSLRLR